MMNINTRKSLSFTFVPIRVVERLQYGASIERQQLSLFDEHDSFVEYNKSRCSGA